MSINNRAGPRYGTKYIPGPARFLGRHKQFDLWTDGSRFYCTDGSRDGTGHLSIEYVRCIKKSGGDASLERDRINAYYQALNWQEGSIEHQQTSSGSTVSQ